MTTRNMHDQSSTGYLDAGALGTLELSWNSDGINAISFLDRPPALSRKKRDAGVEVAEVVEVPLKFASVLRAYLAGDRDADPCSLPIQYLGGTTKQKRVWDALRTIPRGEVRSYRWLAHTVHSIPRAVGQANGANPIPIVVPCHRVINADGTLGGFTSGLARKIFLLELEGLSVSRDRVTKGQLTLV